MSNVVVLLILLAIFLAVAVWRFPRKEVVLNHAIGVETIASPFTELIPAGVTLPFYFSDIFWNGAEDQDTFELVLLQNLSGKLREIDTITIPGLAYRPMGMLEVELRLILNRKKKLTVWTRSKEIKHLDRHGPYWLDD